MLSIALLSISILLFVFLAHMMAKKKGLDPVFWGVMGGLFGPLALPFILLAKSKKSPSRDS